LGFKRDIKGFVGIKADILGLGGLTEILSYFFGLRWRLVEEIKDGMKLVQGSLQC